MAAEEKKRGKRYSFSREAALEPDPEWRAWFRDIEQKRKNQADPKKRPLVFSSYDKEGDSGLVVRRQSEPLPVKRFLKKERQHAGRTLDVDLMMMRSSWNMAVGKEIAESSEVYAFKNGVLTVSVFSSSLLQEIRQFHQEAIARDLRDVWKASQPLVRIVYRQGRRG